MPPKRSIRICQTQVMGNPVRGKALYDAVLSIWLGDHALEEGLREGLLSLPKEEKEN
ncbi:MAG: chalcone isomerase family protein [Parasutterella excrementihominis]